MRIKVEDLIKMSDEIDDIFHKNGFVVDHHILTSHVFNIIKSSYPQDDVELEEPDLTSLLEKYGKDIKDP